ncbi:MAG: glycosyltransferase [Planctomycetota bacterium]
MTPDKNASTPLLSVVLCTHCPDPRLLRITLEALKNQTIDLDRVQVVLVDNASEPPVEIPEDLREALNPELVLEPQTGHMIARLAGIRAARSDLIVFVDDDNELAEDYLEESLRIAEEFPEIGAFGGISEGVFDFRVPSWKRAFLPYIAVRHYGDKVITSSEQKWGKWDPIGAGMVVRRAVAEHYLEFIEKKQIAVHLGRRGGQLMSGDDTLLCRCANLAGFACSYQPSLKLRHYIDKKRLSAGYLKRLLDGHGRTYVRLERLFGRPVAPMAPGVRRMWLFRRLLFRFATARRAGPIIWRWDRGFVAECDEPSPFELPRNETPVAATESRSVSSGNQTTANAATATQATSGQAAIRTTET